MQVGCQARAQRALPWRQHEVPSLAIGLRQLRLGISISAEGSGWCEIWQVKETATKITGKWSRQNGARDLLNFINDVMIYHDWAVNMTGFRLGSCLLFFRDLSQPHPALLGWDQRSPQIVPHFRWFRSVEEWTICHELGGTQWWANKLLGDVCSMKYHTSLNHLLAWSIHWIKFVNQLTTVPFLHLRKMWPRRWGFWTWLWLLERASRVASY